MVKSRLGSDIYYFGAMSYNRTSWELQDFIAAIFGIWPIRNSRLAGTGNRNYAKTGSPWLAIPD
jgi:hypothetical protein